MKTRHLIYLEHPLKSEWIFASALGLLTLFVFWPLTGATLVGDAKVICIPLDFNLETIKTIFTSPYFEGDRTYRPLGTLWLRFFSSLSLLVGLKLHWVSIALHFTNALLLRAFVLKITSKSEWSSLASILFLLHPANTEAICSVVGQNDQIVVLLFLCFGLYLVSRPNKAVFNFSNGLVFSLIIFITPLFKEPGIVLGALAAFLYLWIWYSQPQSGSTRRNAILFASSCAIGFFSYFLFRQFLFPLDLFSQENTQELALFNPLLALSIHNKLLNSFLIMGYYLKLIFFPVTLSSNLYFNQINLASNLFDWRICIALLFLVFMEFRIVYSFIKTKNIVPFVVFHSLIVIYVPFSHWIIDMETIYAERLVYPILPVFCATVSFFLLKLRRHWYLILAILLCGSYGIRTNLRCHDWKNPWSYGFASLRSAPDSVMSNLMVAKLFWVTHEYEQAMGPMNRALELAPNFYRAHILLGLILIDSGHADLAAEFVTGKIKEGKHTNIHSALFLYAMLELDQLPSGKKPDLVLSTFEQARIKQMLRQQLLSPSENGFNQLNLSSPADQLFFLFATMSPHSTKIKLIGNNCAQKEFEHYVSLFRSRSEP